MTLEPVKLDDLTWQDMILAIRRRIAAASGNQWTLHAPVDPGVTLLELYTWLLEQRVYWMDQMSPSFRRAALRLLGEKARTTVSATTVLEFSNYHNVLDRGSEFHLVKDADIVFSTAASVMCLPVAKVGITVGGKEMEPDLLHGRPIALFSSEGDGKIKITLSLTRKIAGSLAAPISLLFDLQTSSRVAPQWSNSAASRVAPPATVKFLFLNDATGKMEPFPWVHDGTAGLRRAGIVRIRVPGEWKPEKKAPGGNYQYSFFLETDEEKFTSPPIIKRLIPNVAIARHRHRIRQKPLSLQWLPLPGNEIALADLDTDAAPIEPAVALRLRERNKEWKRWSPTDDLAFHGPADRVFVIDRKHGVLRFGNGLTGRLPVPWAPEPAGSANVKVCFYAGGGAAGNLGSNLPWVLSKDNDVIEAKNVVGSDGGTEAETAETATDRAGAGLKKITRAVIADDYEQIAITTPGIAIRRAHAAVGYHPNHPCTLVPGAVTIFVVPDAPRDRKGPDDDELVKKVFVAAPVPDPGALAAINLRMNETRLVGSEVFVRAPRYRHVSLSIVVEGAPLDPGAVRDRINRQLRDFLDPLVGGDKKQGWPFGEQLRPSALLRESQRAAGKNGNVVSVFITLLDTETQKAENCSDVPIGEHELVVLSKLDVRFSQTPGMTNKGGLR